MVRIYRAAKYLGLPELRLKASACLGDEIVDDLLVTSREERQTQEIVSEYLPGANLESKLQFYGEIFLRGETKRNVSSMDCDDKVAASPGGQARY